MSRPIDRGTLVSRRDQIQANITQARQQIRSLEDAIQQGIGALRVLDDLLSLPEDQAGAPVTENAD